jgi:hypothetical protein
VFYWRSSPPPMDDTVFMRAVIILFNQLDTVQKIYLLRMTFANSWLKIISSTSDAASSHFSTSNSKLTEQLPMYSTYHLWPWTGDPETFGVQHMYPMSRRIPSSVNWGALHYILNISFAARTQSQTPTRMLNYQATKQEWENSTKRNSKPLHALQGCLASSTSADPIGTMNEIQSQLIPSASIEALFWAQYQN